MTGVCVFFTRVYSNLVNVVGRRAAEKAVLTSRRYGSEDALVIGMVDQVVRKDHVLSEAKKEMEKLLIHPGMSMPASILPTDCRVFFCM